MTHVKWLRNNINTTIKVTFYVDKSPKVYLWVGLQFVNYCVVVERQLFEISQEVVTPDADGYSFITQIMS